jgi:hypothetical protein
MSIAWLYCCAVFNWTCWRAYSFFVVNTQTYKIQYYWFLSLQANWKIRKSGDVLSLVIEFFLLFHFLIHWWCKTLAAILRDLVQCIKWIKEYVCKDHSFHNGLFSDCYRNHTQDFMFRIWWFTYLSIWRIVEIYVIVYIRKRTAKHFYSSFHAFQTLVKQ